jgi:hypothetical protein
MENVDIFSVHWVHLVAILVYLVALWYIFPLFWCHFVYMFPLFCCIFVYFPPPVLVYCTKKNLACLIIT